MLTGPSRQNGTICLPNGIVIGAGLTQDAFRDAPNFANAKSQDCGTPPWIHYHISGGSIDGRELAVSLCFYDQTLVSVDLSVDLYRPGPRSWTTYDLATEAATKDFHDCLLESIFGEAANGASFHAGRVSKDKAILNRPVSWSFPWGKVWSLHDPKGGGTSITVSYGNRHAAAVLAGPR